MTPSDAELDDLWLALGLSPHIGARTLSSLRRYFQDDLAAVMAAPPEELLRVKGVGPAIARYISAIDLNRVARQRASWQGQGVAILHPACPAYPRPLCALDDAPPLLFARGQLEPKLWQHAFAIVGTREPSQEARFRTLQLAAQLARQGCTVVSGLALGIDAAAHTGALSHQGRSIAVLGSGLLNIYPRANRQLAERLLERGGLMSSLHPGWGANAQRLVARNRIISGLSRAVILVESQLDGGAMYTARFAREQGRPVYTYDLPASGNQALLRDGAFVLPADDPLPSLMGSVRAK